MQTLNNNPLSNVKFKVGFKKHAALFAFPNPYDELKREKKGWFVESRKLEIILKNLKINLDENPGKPEE